MCIGSRCVQICIAALTLLILVTESSNMAPNGKELSEDLKRCIVVLHEDGKGYKEIANTLLSLKDLYRSAVSIAAEIEEVGGQLVRAQTIRHTLHQIGVHGCHPRRNSLLKAIHKKACKRFAEDMSTKHMDYWNYVLWCDEMKINLFGSNGFKRVWLRPGEEYKDKCVMPPVKHGGGNVMVWGCMSAAGVGELHFMNSNMFCEILQ